MLELVVEANGNTGGRFYPCTGYFGVTPIVISGTVVTRIPPFAQPLPVRAVYAIVRCVESKGSAERVLWEKVKTVWSSEQYVVIGAWSHPFRITIPPEAAQTATSSMNLKEWRTVWKFEIAIEHEPIPYVGHRITKAFHLDLRNHAQPTVPALPPVECVIGCGQHAATLQATPPEGAFGPEDPIQVAVQTKTHDPSAIVKRATLVLERVMEFLEEDREETAVIASSTGDVTGSDGVYRCCLTVSLPKRTSRWDAGETSKTRLVATRFQLRTKVSIKAKSTREWTCEPMPITVCAASAIDRATAKAAAPVKVRKHRSSRRGLYMQEGTVEISDEISQRSLSPFTPPPSNVKPILLPPDHPAQSQSISFVFPSPPPHASYLGALPPLRNILPEAIDESWTILKRFQQTGRRISTTASEEEALQPSRSRQRLHDLPSLDSLGLGLPTVSRRPMTAPAQFSDAKDHQIPFIDPIRPQTSNVEPSHPQSMLSPRTFAFTIKED